MAEGRRRKGGERQPPRGARGEVRDAGGVLHRLKRRPDEAVQPASSGRRAGLGKSFFTVFDKALRLWRAPVEDVKAKKAVVETAGEALASFMSQRITANELMSVAQIMSDNKKEAITMKHLLNTLEMLREEAS